MDSVKITAGDVPVISELKKELEAVKDSCDPSLAQFANSFLATLPPLAPEEEQMVETLSLTSHSLGDSRARRLNLEFLERRKEKLARTLQVRKTRVDALQAELSGREYRAVDELEQQQRVLEHLRQNLAGTQQHFEAVVKELAELRIAVTRYS